MAVAPVPIEPLSKWAKPVDESSNVKVPIMIRPVALESSGTLNNLKAKYRSTTGTTKPMRPTPP